MIHSHIAYTDFTGYRFKISKAQGSYIWDEKGRKLIDFTSGWNVTNLGWNHPEVNEAMIKQIQKSDSHASSCLWCSVDIQERLAVELTAALRKELDTVARATGGTEANEEALKTARVATGRKKIIGFGDSYHGQSFGAMALGFKQEYVESLAPLLPEVFQIEFPSVFTSGKSEKETLDDFLTKLETLLKKKDVAAIVTEAGIITGWGSVLTAPKGYLTAVRKLTKEYGTLMILDEVGTGFSRCGKLFGMELEAVVPDIVTFAKGITNGASALGAMVGSSDLIGPTTDRSNLTSTFGWMPVSCAAALATLKIHKRDKVWEQAEIKGSYIVRELRKRLADHPKVGDIRGIGMEIGVMFVKDKTTKEPDFDLAKQVQEKTFQDGLHTVYGSLGTIQLMPPLTIEQSVLEEGLNIFVDSFGTVS